MSLNRFLKNDPLVMLGFREHKAFRRGPGRLLNQAGRLNTAKPGVDAKKTTGHLAGCATPRLRLGLKSGMARHLFKRIKKDTTFTAAYFNGGSSETGFVLFLAGCDGLKAATT